MRLTAIMTTEGFAGVVPSDQAAAICKEEGITEYTAIEDVIVANAAPEGAEIIYKAAWDELIEDLEGQKGKLVYKA